jgi:hypothetical protein
MSESINAKFEVTGWEPKPYDESDPAAVLSQITIKKNFSGELEGESAAQGLFCGCSDGSGSYVVLERVTGKAGDREGTFVMQHGGIMKAGAAVGQFGDVIPGSGTGGFAGISGTALFTHDETGATIKFDLTYE